MMLASNSVRAFHLVGSHKDLFVTRIADAIEQPSE
jgi:hypothetical protein